MEIPSPESCRDIESLLRTVATGRRAKYVFFWSDKPHGGAISASCLSQWYPAPFNVGGERYATPEHFMMAEKARIFGDDPARARVLAAGSPGAAKRIGREVRGFVHARWVERRIDVAITGNMAKFSQNLPLGKYLSGTSRRVLVEASPSDRIWGIGLEATDPRASNPLELRGINLLGFALMEARARLENS